MAQHKADPAPDYHDHQAHFWWRARAMPGRASVKAPKRLHPGPVGLLWLLPHNEYSPGIVGIAVQVCGRDDRFGHRVAGGRVEQANIQTFSIINDKGLPIDIDQFRYVTLPLLSFRP